jgi:hypothetical protein
MNLSAALNSFADRVVNGVFDFELSEIEADLGSCSFCEMPVAHCSRCGEGPNFRWIPEQPTAGAKARPDLPDLRPD